MDITWNGDWFYANKSHANIDRETVLGLYKLGHNIRVTNIYDPNNFNSNNENHKLITSFTKNKFESDYNIFKFLTIKYMKKDPKFNCILHSNGSYTISKRINKLISSCPATHLWLPTPDCAEEINKQISIPVVGLGIDSGVDPNRFNINIEPFNYSLFNIGKEMFKFIIACDGASLTPGKPYGGYRGTDIAIKAFVEEFSSKDSVCLIVKIANSYKIIDNFVNKTLNSNQNNPLIVKDFGKDSQDIIAGKWKTSDCMLSPIRDCRWEACCLEALACGTPIIATNCGGPRMYGKKGVYFVDYNIVDGDLWKSRGDVSLTKDYWTEPSIEGFREKMRFVYENREYAKIFGAEGSAHVLNNWKWIDVAQRVVNFFKGV